MSIPKNLLNPAMLDVSFTKPVIASPPEYGRTIEDMYEFRKVMSFKEAGNYRYVLDVSSRVEVCSYRGLCVLLLGGRKRVVEPLQTLNDFKFSCFQIDGVPRMVSNLFPHASCTRH